MKVALCLFGNVGIKQNAALRSWNYDVKLESEMAHTDPKIAYKYYVKNLLNKYDVDIFMHSWSTNFLKELVNLYNPKDHIIEKQKNFPMDLSLYGIEGKDMDNWKISKPALRSYKAILPFRNNKIDVVLEELRRHTFRTTSRWYSNSKVIKIMNDYSLKNNVKYDFVITSRLDCCFLSPFKLDNRSSDLFYASKRIGRDDVNDALYDFWFMSSQENMLKFSEIYDNIYDYSIRPVYACKEHVDKFIGSEKITHMFKNNVDYRKG